MKWKTKILLTAAAVCTAVVLACLAVFLALPSGTSSRYVEGEVYSGEVAGTTEDAAADHGGHSGWTDLNATREYTEPTSINSDRVTVCWEGDTCTISAVYAPEASPVSCRLYLSGDLKADIVVDGTDYSSGNESYNTSTNSHINVDLCLNGYALTGTGSGTVLKMSHDPSSGTSDTNPLPNGSTYCVMSIYDCGGKAGENLHYYKLREDGLTYDFSDDTLTAETADGCVRGGLITGGYLASGRTTQKSYFGGGVSVGRGAELRMYGGTIAGNVAEAINSAGGVAVSAGEFYMYGGSVEGNSGTGAGGVLAMTSSEYSISYDSNNLNIAFDMYGGEIKNNHSSGTGGGVNASGQTTRNGYDNRFSNTLFNIYGGVISGNRADGDGGGVYVSYYPSYTPTSTGSSHQMNEAVGMHGGVIRENVSGGNGGGVCYTVRYGSFTMTGGEITANRAERYGGGVYFNGETSSGYTGVMYLGGDAYVYGNHCAGKINNLYLASGYYVTLDSSSSLTDNALIGVTPASFYEGAQITQTDTDGDLLSAAAKRFVPDDRSWGIEATDSCLALRLKS